MRLEMKRLTILFATFIFAYVLRFFYQLGLGSHIYVRWVPNMIARWGLANTMPIIWDVVSISSICILHFISFREAAAATAQS